MPVDLKALKAAGHKIFFPVDVLLFKVCQNLTVSSSHESISYFKLSFYTLFYNP